MGEVNAIGGVTQCGSRYKEKYEEVHGVKYGNRGLKYENIVSVSLWITYGLASLICFILNDLRCRVANRTG